MDRAILRTLAVAAALACNAGAAAGVLESKCVVRRETGRE